MIQIRYRDAKPMEVQIEEEMIKLIQMRSVSEREPMPSVAELASRLVMNPKRVKVVYDRLLEQGYIQLDIEGNYYPKPGEKVQENVRKEGGHW